MAAIPFDGTAEEALSKIKMVIHRDFPRASLVVEDGRWLRYEFVSAIFRFVDDVEFLVDDNVGLIHFRSASRVGYSDMGANRKRINRISEAFSQSQK